MTIWLASDAQLDTSLMHFVGNRAYGMSGLRSDLDRWAFQLGGTERGRIFDQRQCVEDIVHIAK